MVKVLSFRFQHCFGQITMLLSEGSSETELFRLLSNHVFGGPQVQRYINYDGHLSFENVENWIKIQEMKKNSENIFRFLDNFISKCCYKLALLRREYLLSAVNRLTNSRKILHIIQRLFQPKLPSEGSINMVKVLMFTFEKKKEFKNIFHFWGNCIWKCCYKYFLLRTEFLLSGVNGLTNSPTILHITQRDFLKLSCVHKHQQTW